MLRRYPMNRWVELGIVACCLAACTTKNNPEPVDEPDASDPCAKCTTAQDCVDGECVRRPCTDWECGTDEGEECGSCAAGNACNEGHQCVAVCDGVECGTVNGIDCGSCSNDQVCQDNVCLAGPCASCGADEECVDNTCQPVCRDAECGTVNGVDCGSCEEGLVCSANRCGDPCGAAECGTVSGVDCGSCEQGFGCSPEGRCVVACESVECGLDNGVDCGSCGEGTACDRGFCVLAACDSSKAKFCRDGDVYECNDGVSATPLEACATWEYCEEQAGTARCVNQTCRRFSTGCVGEIYGQCADDGSGLMPGTEVDCAAGGLECSVSGCGSVNVDDVGSPATYSISVESVDYWMAGNFYEVTTTVTLAEFMPQLTFSGNWELVFWVVYSSDTRTGYYFQEIAHTNDGGPADGLIGPPPAFNWTLEAGRYYFIGVKASTRNALALTYYNNDTGIEKVSFGTLLSGFIGEEPADLYFDTPSGYVATQRVVTVELN